MSNLYVQVVNALGIAILVHTRDTRFCVETAPRWLQALIEGVAVGDVIDLVERFPFLESFMPEAQSVWSDPIPGVETSGIWVEQQSSEVEIPLEALATRSHSDRLLLLRIPWAEYEEKRDVLTKARTSKLEHDRLRKEIQKKEILLHCIVHDLSNPLSGIKGSLDLIRRQPLESTVQKYVDIGLTLCDDQQRLIRSILDAFSAELKPGGVDALLEHEVADAVEALRSVREKLMPSFVMHDVLLELRCDVSGGDSGVAIDAASLERVLLNLAENALRHSPRGSTVGISVRRQGSSLTFAVDDRGPGVPAELKDTLFDKFSQGKDGRGKVGLGLYFCRITAERWQGSIGHDNLPDGGSRFWLTLPAYDSADAE